MMQQRADLVLAEPREKRFNPNCISYWFPLLEASEVPVPKTEIISNVSREILNILDGKESPEFNALAEHIIQSGHRLGWPCFLKGGEYSGKHSWKDTCYLPHPKIVKAHLVNLINDGECANFFGFEWDCFAVRELIPAHKGSFLAFSDMPVRKERRAFVDDGKFYSVIPYWPDEAFEHSQKPDDWKEQLSTLNTMSEREQATIKVLSEKATAAFTGRWSLDWMWTDNRGWVAIDMASANKSWGCPEEWKS